MVETIAVYFEKLPPMRIRPITIKGFDVKDALFILVYGIKFLSKQKPRLTYA